MSVLMCSRTRLHVFNQHQGATEKEAEKNAPNPFFRRLGETVEQSTGNAAIVDDALDDLRLGLPFTHPLVGLEDERGTKDDAGAILWKKKEKDELTSRQQKNGERDALERFG